MKILFSTPYYAPAYYFGGPVRVLETLARELVAAGHEVTVATTDALDASARVPAGEAPVPPEAEVVRFPNVVHSLATNAMGWSPRGHRAWLRANVARFDVVHLNDLYSVVSVAAARAAVRAGVPFVLQPHGSTAPSAERGRPMVKRVFLAAWGRRTLREASATLAATAAEHADLMQAGAPAERIHQIPAPLDLPEVAGRAALPEEPTVVFVGRLDPIKRVDLLIDAAVRAGVRLRVVGTGPQEPALRAHAGRTGLEVEWTGFLDGEAKVRALQGAHAFALLSRSEGLPVAALEAMACGTPAIVSRACNIPEIDGTAGAVVDLDPAAAADGITRVLADRGRLATGATQFAAGYRADRVLPRLIALYEALSTRSTERPQS